MDMNKLQASFKELADFPKSSVPMVSCYLNPNEEDLAETIRLRHQCLRLSLTEESSREDLDEAFERINQVWTGRRSPDANGLVIFCRGGSDPYLQTLQFYASLETQITVGESPHLFQLVQLKKTYERYVVLLTTERQARILEVNLGEITNQLLAAELVTRDDLSRNFSKQHFQSHLKDRAGKFFKEKIKVLEKVIHEGRHEHLMIVGDKRNIAHIKDKLPQRLKEKLIDHLAMPAATPARKIVDACMERFARHEQEGVQAQADLLLREVQNDELAVCGSDESFAALVQGRVDTLVVCDSYPDQLAWHCTSCYTRALGDAQSCTFCSGTQLRHSNAREELISLAHQMNSKIAILKSNHPLERLGHVGCLLRY